MALEHGAGALAFCVRYGGCHHGSPYSLQGRQPCGMPSQCIRAFKGFLSKYCAGALDITLRM